MRCRTRFKSQTLICNTRRPWRRREGMCDFPGGQRLQRQTDDGSQRTSVYELDRRPELTHCGAARYRGRSLLPTIALFIIRWSWTCVYELDRRRELHDNGVADCRLHVHSRELLSSCADHHVERTFMRHTRRTWHGSTGAMRRTLLQYALLCIFASYQDSWPTFN